MTTLLPKIAADFKTQLATGVSIGDTTSSPVSNTDSDGVALSDGKWIFTVNGDDSSKKEYIICTKTGANLTSVQNVSRQGVITTGFAKAHRIGASVSVTDFASLLFIKNLLDGTTDLNSSLPLKYDGVATLTPGSNQLATVAYVDGVSIAGAAKASTATFGISKLSVVAADVNAPIVVGDNDPRVPTQNENDAMVGVSGSGVSSSNKFVDDLNTAVTSAASKVVRANSSGKIDPSFIQSFSGDGSDGALSLSSGTTNIDLGAAQVVIKQYTSVSITGTGQVTTSNPHANGTILIIKSQGGVTMTSSVIPNFDMSGMGGAAGTGGAISTSGTNQINNPGTDAVATITNFQGDTSNSNGKGGAGSAVTGGAAGAIFGNLFMYTLSDVALTNRRITIAPGFGGGGGAGGQSQFNGSSAGAAGGRGGGALVIQCGGALNFTSTLGIDVSGKNGSSAANISTSGQTGAGGGGGGGGSGMCLILYNTLTAATGTVNAKGGTGGAGGNATTTTANGSAAGTGGGGSGGGTYVSAGGAGGNGGAGGGTNGSAGGSPSGGAGGGGGGGASGSGSGSWTGGAGGTSTTSTSLWYIAKNYFIA